MNIGRRLSVIMLPFVIACGSSGAAPSSPTAAVLTLRANPNPASSAVCTDCGPGSTDREVQTTLTLQETAGVALTANGIDMALRNSTTNAVIASGTFDSTAVTQLAGTARIGAGSSLSVRCSVHYPAAQAGAAGSFTLTVRATDDRGNQLTQSATVAVPST